MRESHGVLGTRDNSDILLRCVWEYRYAFSRVRWALHRFLGVLDQQHFLCLDEWTDTQVFLDNPEVKNASKKIQETGKGNR